MVKHPSSRAERLKIKRKKDVKKDKSPQQINKEMEWEHVSKRKIRLNEIKLRETDDDLKNIDDISWQPERRYRVISQE